VAIVNAQQYGDITKLQKLASGMKRQGGTYGAMVQTGGPGRPPTSGVPTVPKVAQQQPQVPPEHLSAMQDYAQKQALANQWRALTARPDAGPWINFYARVAQNQADLAAQNLKVSTPDFAQNLVTGQ
jgi:hypothetical protein